MSVPPGALPSSLALTKAMEDQRRLARAQAMNQAMQARFLQPQQGQMVSGHYVGPGIGGAISQVLGAYLTGKGAEKIDQRQEQNALDLGQARIGAVNEAMNTPNGYMSLFSSNDPALQQLGLAMMKNQGENAITPKDLLAYSDPEALPGLVKEGISGFRPKQREMKEVGGVLYDPKTMTTVRLNGSGPETLSIGGDLYERNPSTGQLKKLDNAPKVNVRVNNQTQMGPGGYQQAYEIARGQAQGGVDAKRMEAAIEGLSAANANLQQLAQLEEASKQPYFSGAFADQRLAAEKMAQSLGLPVDAKKIANTEQLATLSAQNVLEKAKNMKGALSDKDVEFLSRSTPGQLSSPEGLRAIIRASRKVTLAEAKKHQETIEALSGESRQMNLPAGNFSAGSPTLPGSDAPISLDEYLNRGR